MVAKRSEPFQFFYSQSIPHIASTSFPHNVSTPHQKSIPRYCVWIYARTRYIFRKSHANASVVSLPNAANNWVHSVNAIHYPKHVSGSIPLSQTESKRPFDLKNSPSNTGKHLPADFYNLNPSA